MEVYVAQLVGIIVLFCVTTLVGIIPSWLIYRRGNEWSESRGFTLLISIANSLASGVFMEICFLGLIPLVQEEFSSLWKELSIDMHYPLGEALILIGFFLILAIENVALWLQQQGTKTNMGMKTLSVHDVTAELGNRADARAFVRTQLNGTAGEIAGEAAPLNNPVDHQNSTSTGVTQEPATTVTHSGHDHGNILLNEGSGLRFLMLLAAISVHSLLEGMAIGLQESIPLVVNLFVGILIHETLVALAIGIKVAQHTNGIARALRLICTFTLMIPLGIGLGIGLGSTEGATGHAVSGVCQALAAGVFLHVTFMELVPEELRNSKNALVSITCMLTGFLSMSAIAYFVEHSH